MDQLRKLAAERKLRPDDKVSVDQKQWVTASRVPGLMSLQGPLGSLSDEDEAKSFRAVPIDVPAEEDDDEYSLSPVVEPPAPLPIEEELKPTQPSFPPGTQRLVEVPQRGLGMAWGALIAVMLFVLSLPLGLIVDVMLGGELGQQLAYFPICAMILGAGAFLIATLGTSNTFEMQVAKDGAEVLYTSRFAYFPWLRWQLHVSPGDRLEKRVRLISGMFTETTALDIAVILLAFVCCAVGGIPGLVVWALFFQTRSGAGETLYRFQLMLISPELPKPVMLHEERVENYFATRFGTPSAAAEMIKLLEAAIPGIPVDEVEQ